MSNETNSLVVTETARGFQIAEFDDHNGEKCSIQQSSAIDDTSRGFNNPGSSYLWLGRSNDRMHIDRRQARELVKLMRNWLKTGNLA